MATGLTETLNRFATIIEGAPSGKWKRNKQRLSSPQSEEPKLLAASVEHRYWISARLRQQREVVASSLTTSRVRVFVELSRHWGGGDALSKEYFGLHKALEAEADVVEQSILYVNNWSRSTTGIILVTMLNSRTQDVPPLPVLLWVAEFEVLIRHTQSAVTVS